MAKIYLADNQDYIVAYNFDNATEKFIEVRGKDPGTLSLFKDIEFVIEDSTIVEITPVVMPTLAADDGALVSPSTVVYIKENDMMTFVATPSINYTTFDNWTDGEGNILSTDNPFTYTAGTVDMIINANFSA